MNFVFPVIMMTFFISRFVESELLLSQQGLSENEITEDLHGFRVKRSWIWNHLSVEEEDPTFKIIGQVNKNNCGRNVFCYILNCMLLLLPLDLKKLESATSIKV